MEDELLCDDDAIAMGNLAYVLAYLADLDRSYRACSGVSVILGRGGNGGQSYELRITTAVATGDGELSVVDTVAVLEDAAVAQLVAHLADGVDLHGRSVKDICADIWPAEREQGR